jgi:hypothetical protein
LPPANFFQIFYVNEKRADSSKSLQIREQIIIPPEFNNGL